MFKRSTLITHNPLQTKKAGESLARDMLKTKRRGSLVVGLVGELGGGKTTIIQGLAKGLNIREKILSPTFIIMRRFKIKDLRFKDFYHIDCYRIRKPEELSGLGFKEIISDSGNIVAIEWADRVKSLLPKKYILVKFEFVGPNTRKITIERRNE